MKKEEFLTKLKKNLSVLEEKEVQDIIEEYEQHIDMKMQGGLSEEAAIADFGDLKELTAGILEAYHVKVDYQVEKKNLDFEKVKEESKKATEKATSAIGKGAGVIGKGVGACGRGIGVASKWCVKQLKSLWEGMKKPFAKWKENAKNREKDAQGKGVIGKLWVKFINLCMFIWSCILWVIGFFWDLCWILIALLFGLGTVICVFLFGISIVLLISGYPLIGITLALIGAGVVCTAFALLSLMLLQKRPEEVKTHA